MTPEQWDRIGEIYHHVPQVPDHERNAFIEQAALGDVELSVTVKRLLVSGEQAKAFLEIPAFEVAAQLIAEHETEYLIGQKLGNYEVLGFIKAGGMGHVYEAQDTALHRRVALKIISNHVAGDPNRMKLVRREAKTASAVRHPNIVSIYDIGEENGVSFIAMEYLEGKTISERIEEAPFQTNEIVKIGLQVADALKAVHLHGITHRDIKPSNLMLTPQGQVKLLDFGLAKISHRSVGDGNESAVTNYTTAPGMVMGTPQFASPEQLSGADVDHRSDIFSLGAVLHEMVAASKRCVSPTVDCSNQVPRQPEVRKKAAEELDRIIRKCLEREPAQRYDAAGLLGDLTKLQRKLTQGREKMNWIVAAFSILLLLLALPYLYSTFAKPAAPGLELEGQRLFVSSSSEGRAPKKITLSHKPEHMAISNDGAKIFALDGYDRVLSIVSTTDFSIKTLALPMDGATLRVSPSGKLFIGSPVEGIMVVNASQEAAVERRIPTGGPVIDMAFSPDGETLFLAMGNSGLKRLSVASGTVVPISQTPCPEYLEIDPRGARLYVSYQCSGLAGTPGHDVLEVYDVKSATLLGRVGGTTIPMVLGKPAVSPDGQLIILDGTDACSRPTYDHVGCKSYPSHVFHLLDSLQLKIIRSFEYPANDVTGHAVFLDNLRMVVPGPAVSVVDTNRSEILEKLSSQSAYVQSVLFSPDKRRAYLGIYDDNSIFVINTENAQCSPLKNGLGMFFPADGSVADTVGTATVTHQGQLQFTPGKVGQAVFLDGNSFFSADGTGHYQLGLHDFSVAFYVKFETIQGEMTLIDWTAENPRRGIRLVKTIDNLLTLESWPNGSTLKSTTKVKPGIWYHVVVTRRDEDSVLYINGQSEDIGSPPTRVYAQLGTPVFFGAQAGQPTLRGWLDEAAFYNRSLTPEEVKSVYQSREAGPCKM